MFRLTLLGISVAAILGQVPEAQGTELEILRLALSGGPFGALVFLMITDKLVTPGERDRLRSELAASHEREHQLNEDIRSEIVPLMTRSIEAHKESSQMTKLILDLLDDETRFPRKK